MGDPRVWWAAIVSVALLVDPAAAAGGAGEPPPEALAAAQAALPAWLARMDDGLRSSAGFAGESEVQQATIGHAIQHYALDPGKLADAGTDADLVALLEPRAAWSFLVSGPGKGRILLSMEKNGAWEATTLGLAPIAHGIDQLVRDLTGGSTVHLGLAVMRPGIPSVAIVSGEDGLRAAILDPTGADQRPPVLKPAGETLKELKPAAEAAIENARQMSEHEAQAPGGGVPGGGGGGPPH